MFKNTRNLARKYGSKALVMAAAATASVGAFAQETNPIITLLNGITLTGVAAAILALAVIVVSIALTMKGPDVAKRIIRKV
ncbi:hypothetical protein ACSFBX_03745 [Variovorax sp. RB2P76]|uniref:hypothetical protein n=1 Tax=Variovorax sp. RB2P76 TaxID=3443736 RepID=UPI003F46A8F8